MLLKEPKKYDIIIQYKKYYIAILRYNTTLLHYDTTTARPKNYKGVKKYEIHSFDRSRNDEFEGDLI
jgi:hypothetical protein